MAWQNIQHVSDLTTTDLSDYLRLSISDENELTTYLNVAKTFVMQYTGLAEDELDNHQDLVIVVLVLVQDMYDNRVLYVDKTNLNKVVETILGMHSVNLLPQVEDDD